MVDRISGSIMIKAELGAPELQAVRVPVELIGHKLKGYARGFLNEQLSVFPGKYLVSLTLPDGRTVVIDKPIKIKAGENPPIDLGALAGTPSELQGDAVDETAPMAAEGTPSTFSATVAQSVEDLSLREHPAAALGRQSQSRRAAEPVVMGETRVWRGNWLKEWLDEPRRPTFEVATRVVQTSQEVEVRKQLTVSPDGFQDALLLISQTDRVSCFVIPFDEPLGDARETVTAWRRQEAGTSSAERPSLDYDFGSLRTNAFLHFIRRGERAVSRELSRQELVSQAEALAYGKTESPLGAALGLYVLLRVNELDDVDVWTRNLFERFQWLPDALAIRVEYLARTGEHTEAVRLLLQNLPLFRCPWFRSGVVYLFERLRLYVTVSEEERLSLGIKPNDTEQLRRYSVALRRASRYLDTSETVCVYRDLPLTTLP